jgi:hypothetical protein
MAATLFPHTFRPAVLPIYLMLGVPTQLVLMALLGGSAAYSYATMGVVPTEGQILGGGVACLVCGLCLIPAALELAHHHRVKLGRYGVETRDDRGFRCILGWNGIDSAEVVQFWGWRTLRVRTLANRVAWLPVHVARGEEYRETVARFAGEDHPVSRALAASCSSERDA